MLCRDDIGHKPSLVLLEKTCILQPKPTYNREKKEHMSKISLFPWHISGI